MCIWYKIRTFVPMRTRKIDIYCKCEWCNGYFEVTGRKRRRFCDRSCREKDDYSKKKKTN